MSFPRSLTADEHRLVRWMIEHGDEEPDKYLAQLEQAKVVSQCDCGCASIDFQIGDLPIKHGEGMHPFSDFTYGDESKKEYFGAFLFTCGGTLAGLEVWSALDAPAPLPRPEDLREIKKKTEEPNQTVEPSGVPPLAHG